MTVTRPRISHVAGRTPGSGPVIAVLTDGPTDMAVAAQAAGISARHGVLLVAAAAVHPSGSNSADLDLWAPSAGPGRLHAETNAIVARVTPILFSAGVAFLRTPIPVPPATDTLRALPVTAVHRLVQRFGAVTVVTATPLHDPTGMLRPEDTFPANATHPGMPSATPSRPAPAR